jgi:hypothetical protein
VSRCVQSDNKFQFTATLEKLSMARTESEIACFYFIETLFLPLCLGHFSFKGSLALLVRAREERPPLEIWHADMQSQYNKVNSNSYIINDSPASPWQLENAHSRRSNEDFFCAWKLFWCHQLREALTLNWFGQIFSQPLESITQLPRCWEIYGNAFVDGFIWISEILVGHSGASETTFTFSLLTFE